RQYLKYYFTVFMLLLACVACKQLLVNNKRKHTCHSLSNFLRRSVCLSSFRVGLIAKTLVFSRNKIWAAPILKEYTKNIYTIINLEGSKALPHTAESIWKSKVIQSVEQAEPKTKIELKRLKFCIRHKH